MKRRESPETDSSTKEQYHVPKENVPQIIEEKDVCLLNGAQTIGEPYGKY